jgi:hypothetical protein
MKKFLDPVANAKALSFIFFAPAILSILRLPSRFDLTSFIINIIYIIIGYGLWKTKRWSIYALGGLTVYNILMLGLTKNDNYLINVAMVIGIIINISLFFWFYPLRSKFKP